VARFEGQHHCWGHGRGRGDCRGYGHGLVVITVSCGCGPCSRGGKDKAVAVDRLAMRSNKPAMDPVLKTGPHSSSTSSRKLRVSSSPPGLLFFSRPEVQFRGEVPAGPKTGPQIFFRPMKAFFALPLFKPFFPPTPPPLEGSWAKNQPTLGYPLDVPSLHGKKVPSSTKNPDHGTAPPSAWRFPVKKSMRSKDIKEGRAHLLAYCFTPKTQGFSVLQ